MLTNSGVSSPSKTAKLQAHWNWQFLLVAPLPVVPKGSGHDGHARSAHQVEAAVEVPLPPILSVDVRVRPAGVEATGDGVQASRAGQELGQQVWVAERVAKDLATALVKVLSVHEDGHPRLGIAGGERWAGG